MKIRTMVYALVLALVSVLVTAPGAAAATNVTNSNPASFPGHVGGAADAAYLKVPGGLVNLSVGPLFYINQSCGVVAKTTSASGASLQLPGIATGGAATDNLVSTRSTTSAGITATSSISALSLFNGLITVDAIQSTATTTATSAGATSTGSVTFTNLIVGSTHIAASPAPNTKLNLVGIGTITIFKRSGPVNHLTDSSVGVAALDISVTLSNSFSLPIGAEIIIGAANTNYTPSATDSVVSTSAYGLYAYGLLNSASSGPWAPANTGCVGGSATASLTNESVAGILTTGTLADSSMGAIGPSTTTASGTSTVQAISLLGGLITANAVTVNAAVDTGADTATGSMTLTNLKVAGLPVSLSNKVNLTINLAGVGKVVINEQSLHPSMTAASATVNAIDVYITHSNLLGIPVGGRIIIAHVKVTANNY